MSLRVERLSSLQQIDKSCEDGPLRGWDALVESSKAAVFQSRIWCTTWYRSYVEEFDPLLLIAVRGEGELAGIAPLAVERATGRLAFAGDNMADYRDVPADSADACRALVAEALRIFRDDHGAAPFQLGWTRPESETCRIAESLLGEMRLSGDFFADPCWIRRTPLERKMKRSSRRIKYFERQGELTAMVLDSALWEKYGSRYFAQHSLRQLAARRPMAYHNPARRAFYDQLASTPAAHISALLVGERLVAAHYGFLQEGVLYFGPPSFDLAEEYYSPGLLLMDLLARDPSGYGFQVLDMTVGDTDFKRRLGEEMLLLPRLTIHPAKTSLRLAATAAVRRMARKMAEATVGKEKAKAIVRGVEQAVSQPPLSRIWIYDIETSPRSPGVDRVRSGSLEDLLLASGTGRRMMNRLADAANQAASAITEGGQFYSMVIDGALAGWIVEHGEAEVVKPMPGLEIRRGENEILAAGLYVMPGFRDRGIEAELISAILARHEGMQTLKLISAEPYRAQTLAPLRLRSVASHAVLRFRNWSRRFSR